MVFTGEDEQYNGSAFVPVEVKAGKTVNYYYILSLVQKILF